QASIDHQSVLLIAYDLPYPEPLREKRPICHPFASALLIARARSARSLASCALEGNTSGAPSRMEDRDLEELRRDNPAARSLPLLAALAGARATRVFIDSTAGESL